jgi:hypothetical protein
MTYSAQSLVAARSETGEARRPPLGGAARRVLRTTPEEMTAATDTPGANTADAVSNRGGSPQDENSCATTGPLSCQRRACAGSRRERRRRATGLARHLRRQDVVECDSGSPFRVLRRTVGHLGGRASIVPGAPRYAQRRRLRSRGGALFRVWRAPSVLHGRRQRRRAHVRPSLDDFSSHHSYIVVILATHWVKAPEPMHDGTSHNDSTRSGSCDLLCIGHRWSDGQLSRPWARNVSPLGLDLC